LLLVINGIRCERMLFDQLDYNLLSRWFFRVNLDDPVWHLTTFTKNCDRLLNEELLAKFLDQLFSVPVITPLLSSEHFSLEDTLLRAWASYRSLEWIDGLDDDPPAEWWQGPWWFKPRHVTCQGRFLWPAALQPDLPLDKRRRGSSVQQTPRL
jgi:hypothetical protein